MRFIVEIERGVWLARWPGTPGRTFVRKWARVYPTRRGARAAALRAVRLRPGLMPKIVEVE